MGDDMITAGGPPHDPLLTLKGSDSLTANLMARDFTFMILQALSLSVIPMGNSLLQGFERSENLCKISEDVTSKKSEF